MKHEEDRHILDDSNLDQHYEIEEDKDTEEFPLDNCDQK